MEQLKLVITHTHVKTGDYKGRLEIYRKCPITIQKEH